MRVFDIVLAILGISLLVVIHESGHYFAARFFGMRVERFSIGFGPALFRYRPKGSPTIFQVCAVPFLAYVQIAGMNPSEEVDTKDPELFPNKSLLARMVTIFAGPFANYLTASILIFAIALSGWPKEVVTAPMTVAQVVPHTVAARAGLRAGDVIVEANGVRVRTVNDLKRITSARAGQPTDYIVKRGGRTLPIRMTPAGANGQATIGVFAQADYRYVPQSASAAALLAVAWPYEQTLRQLTGIADLFKNRTTEGLTGPVGMGKWLADKVLQRPIEYILKLVMLSVALGMFNLLPFPALDGGRLAFLGYEVITRRRPNERVEAIVHTVGLLFLLGVLVLVTFRDVMS